MPLTDADLLRRLVAIDSTSAVSNLPIADFIADYLGAPATEYLRAGDKTNLLIRFGPDADGGLILSGHMDAVPAGETNWESDPFTLTEHEDRYVGRGAADMKGFLAVAMNAALASSNLRRPLYLLFTYDEEVGTLGAKQFAETYQGPLPKYCIIGEPTSFRPVRAHKGHLKLRVATTGKSAHSGYPHLGDNAIEKARPVLDGLVSLRRALEAEPTEHQELFADAPYVPLNIATIRGGTAVNIVPDRCEIELGIRLLPGMSADEMLARVHSVIGETSIEVLSNTPPLLTSRDSALYQAVLPHAAKGMESVSFASDAGWLQTLGMECLLFGPGAIEVAHKANEFTSKEELHRAGGILRELIARFCA
ncbi:MAG TPA: acetylornithine deacetylase [Thermoanaerobaculia bacterium]|jgi:acetylornithine deacetylase|nr:acetylornithine deacetylase [Thermoanaerobaculia bacterium]